MRNNLRRHCHDDNKRSYPLSNILLLMVALLHGVGCSSEPLLSSPPRVQVQAYTEALCIDCYHFILEDLIPTYNQLGDDVIDLDIVPFGNAQIMDEQNAGEVECQHGAAECDANSWEQCVIYVAKHHDQGMDQNDATSSSSNESSLSSSLSSYSTTKKILNYFYCIESRLPMGHEDEIFSKEVFLQCASPRNDDNAETIDRIHLEACHDNSLLSWNLQLQAAHSTPEDHTFVPWVLVNGKFVDVEKERLLDRICAEYQATGGNHPSCTH